MLMKGTITIRISKLRHLSILLTGAQIGKVGAEEGLKKFQISINHLLKIEMDIMDKINFKLVKKLWEMLMELKTSMTTKTMMNMSKLGKIFIQGECEANRKQPKSIIKCMIIMINNKIVIMIELIRGNSNRRMLRYTVE